MILRTRDFQQMIAGTVYCILEAEMEWILTPGKYSIDTLQVNNRSTAYNVNIHPQNNIV